MTTTTLQEKSTPRGFEPLRAEPNGFLVHLLNHSDTVSTQHNDEVPPYPDACRNISASAITPKPLEPERDNSTVVCAALV